MKALALALVLLFSAAAEEGAARCTTPTGFALEGDVAHTIPPGVVLVRGHAENVAAFLKQRGYCVTALR